MTPVLNDLIEIESKCRLLERLVVTFHGTLQLCHSLLGQQTTKALRYKTCLLHAMVKNRLQVHYRFRLKIFYV